MLETICPDAASNLDNGKNKSCNIQYCGEWNLVLTLTILHLLETANIAGSNKRFKNVAKNHNKLGFLSKYTILVHGKYIKPKIC